MDLDMHRSIDDLGKFSAKLDIFPDSPLDAGKARELVERVVLATTQACMEAGADMIGHVKAFLEGEGGTVRANLISFRLGMDIDDDINGEMGKGNLFFHIIVHGLWDPQVREVSLREMDKAFKDMGVRYAVMQDYYEKEKRVG